MKNILKKLRINSKYLYKQYCEGLLSEKEYRREIKHLDQAIDKIELRSLNPYLQDRSVFGRSFLKHLH